MPPTGGICCQSTYVPLVIVWQTLTTSSQAIPRRRKFDLPIRHDEPILAPKVVQLDLGANEKLRWLGGVPYLEKQRAG
jgi:hypothetical protein